MKYSALSLILVLSNCSPSLSQSLSQFSFNNVDAIIGNEGYFFNNSFYNEPGYEVPKNLGANTIYSASLWIGAENNNGTPQISRGTYYQSNSPRHFSPGPISNNNSYSSQNYIENYGNSIWTVSKSEILNHQQHFNDNNYVTPPTILSWPGNGKDSLGVSPQLAPYVDINLNGTYEPLLGDYPNIPGDQATFVIINNQHATSDSSELKAEVHLLFYQFGTNDYLNNQTFLNTKVFNRGDENFSNFKQSFFLDFDLGNFSNDFVGCSQSNNLAYVYNGTSSDPFSSGIMGYGGNIPAFGCKILNHEMSAFSYLNSTSLSLNDSWNLMNSIWPDGTDFTEGGTGVGGSTLTNYIFNGNPNNPSEWSEESLGNAPGDRRTLQTISTPTLDAGDMICSDYVFVFSQNGERLQSVTGLYNIAQTLQTFYDNSSDFPCQSTSLNSLTDIQQIDFNLFPNPTNGETNIFLPENISNGNISVISSDGKTVLTKDFDSNSTSFSIKESGVYFVRIESEGIVGVKKLVVK